MRQSAHKRCRVDTRSEAITKNQPSLPANRAFTVQFRAPAAAGPEESAGRVEHLVSGQATHFQSWAELRAFIEGMLASVEDKPP